ncbi:hypothetical protein HK102_011522 [Quaeritorhiza haematococci]|nr:hypothetical protein HK102_011522 [Quaeritorhiza haematococci]
MFWALALRKERKREQMMKAVFGALLSFFLFGRLTVAQNETVIKIGWATADQPIPALFPVDTQQVWLPELFIDYWANKTGGGSLFPPGVTVKLVRSTAHNRDRGRALLTTIDLISQNISSFIGDVNSALTSVENNVLQVYNILQCSDVATSSVLGDKTLYPGLLLANPRLTTGTARATVDFLIQNNLKRVALVLETDDPSSETVQAGIVREGQARNISFIVSLSITRPQNLSAAYENPTFVASMNQVVNTLQESKAKVIICTGSAASYFLYNEAVQRGYSKESVWIFVNALRISDFIGSVRMLNNLTETLTGTFQVAGLTNAVQYNQSDVKLLADLWFNRNATIYPSVLTGLSPSMDTRGHCMRVLVYTFAEIIKRGLATPQDIASGKVLSKVPFREFVEIANDLKIDGLVSPYTQFDVQTGMRLTDTGIYNSKWFLLAP